MKGHIISSFFLMGIYAAMVNPFIGTDFTGNTYPGAQAPFGMVQLSPDNGLGGWNRISGYYYPDSTIASFSHTHLSCQLQSYTSFWNWRRRFI